MGDWNFLTNHARVLACIAEQPGVRLREIAAYAEVTERAAHRYVSELEADGYLTRHRVGARNFYELHPDLPLRHPAKPHLTIGELLRLLVVPHHPAAEPEPGATRPLRASQ